LAVPVFFPPNVPYTTYSPLNLGTARLYGIDLSVVGGSWGALDWGFAYRLTAVETDFRSSQIDFKHASPRHLVSARLGRTEGALELDLFTRYASETMGWRVINESDAVLVHVRDHVSIAARAAYRLQRGLTLALEGENLLYARQRQSFAAVAERRVFMSLRADF
jgi:outer membrane receptor for ferrienterochelin and colicins